MEKRTWNDLVQAVAPFGVETRRWLHMHPELSFAEKETSAYIASRLIEMGYTPQTGIGGGYGIKAVLQGARPGKTIALRADMDALPISEATELEYASQVPGVMHACGHDMHTATLLAVAKALKQVAHELSGTVVFLFQPAEETPPGGAKAMIEDGALENPAVDAVFGLHVDPFLPAGELSFLAGPVNGAPDLFDITIQGRGGHGAAPHQTVDAVLVGAQVLNALQHIHSRQISPLERLVITVGHFTGGSKHNIVADGALLQGTVRTMSEELRANIESMMDKVIAGVCAIYGATYTFNYTYGYQVLINDAAMTDLARSAAVATVGADKVRVAEAGMYGEDFAYYLQQRPGCFGNLGAATPGASQCFPCHHPKLMLADELAMPVGVAFYLNLVRQYLGAR